MGGSLEGFIAKWAASGAAERANKDSFLRERCDVLEVPDPDPTTGDANADKYVFERDASRTKGARDGAVPDRKIGDTTACDWCSG